MKMISKEERKKKKKGKNRNSYPYPYHTIPSQPVKIVILFLSLFPFLLVHFV